MKNMKRMIALVLCLALALSTVACGNTADTTTAAETKQTTEAASQSVAQETEQEPAGASLSFVPGSYLGTADGVAGPLTVRVQVSENAIKGIHVIESHESANRTRVVTEYMIPEILEHQTLEIDTVSGATLTSFHFKTAVENALVKAGADESLLYTSYEKEIVTYEDGAQYDVIIVGAGVAGMFAAIELHELNPDLKVLLLEKTDMIGGSASVSGGYILCLESESLVRSGLNRTPENVANAFAEYSSLYAGMPAYDENYQVNRELLLSTGANLAEVWNILNKEDAPYDHGRPITYPNTQLSTYGPDELVNLRNNTTIGGAELVAYLERLFDGTCELRLASNVTELIVDGNQVTGVVVEGENQTYQVYAEDVILATGGIGSNEDLMAKYNPYYTGHMSLAHSGTTGDAFTLTEDLGIDVVGWGLCGVFGADYMPHAFFYPYGVFGETYSTTMVTLDGNIITEREGLNATAEKQGYNLWDASSQYYSLLEDLEKYRIGFKADTIEELVDEIAAYHGEVNKEAMIASLKQIASDKGLTAPFYGFRVTYGFYEANVGIVVNEHCQPVTANGVIDGLYMAGGMLMGNYYIGAYAQVGSGIGLAASSGVTAAKHICGVE